MNGPTPGEFTNEELVRQHGTSLPWSFWAEQHKTLKGSLQPSLDPHPADIVLSDGETLRAHSSSWAVFRFLRMTVEQRRPTPPTHQEIHSAVRMMVGGNPSMTTIHKYSALWKNSEKASAPTRPSEIQSFMSRELQGLCVTLGEQIAIACNEDAARRLDIEREQMQSQLSLASDAVRQANADRDAALVAAGRSDESARAAQNEARLALERVGASDALYQAEKDGHHLTRAELQAVRVDLNERINALDRSRQELEEARSRSMVELADLRGRQAKASEALAQTREELAAQRHSADAARHELIIARAHAEKAAAENQRLLADLSQARERAEHLQGSLSASQEHGQTTLQKADAVTRENVLLGEEVKRLLRLATKAESAAQQSRQQRVRSIRRAWRLRALLRSVAAPPAPASRRRRPG